MKKGFQTVSKVALSRLARRLLVECAAFQSKKRAGLVLLNGNLGSGKTTFTQTVAKALGIRDKILSPTFVFAHEHAVKKKFPYKHLIHIDAYRIETKRDVRAVGILGYLKNPENLVIIEWGDRIRRWLPKPNIVIEFKHHAPKLRKVRITRPKP